MTELLISALVAATANNFVLVRLLGLSPLLDSVPNPAAIRDLVMATTGVLTITGGLCHALDQWVLIPYGLPYLRILGFLAITLLVIHLINILLRRPKQELALVPTTGVVLGVTLLTSGSTSSLSGALALGFGAGAGFSLVVLLFASLRPRLLESPVPGALRGPGIALLTVGMMSLAFLGFSGLGS